MEEKVEKITIEHIGEAVVKDVKSSYRVYLYFKGWPHIQHLPKQWGVPDV